MALVIYRRIGVKYKQWRPRFNVNRAAPSDGETRGRHITYYSPGKMNETATSSRQPLLPYTLEAVQVAEAGKLQSPNWDD